MVTWMQALKRYNGGGDPNYVANVRRFLPGGTPATGGGTRTAQAPPSDPRVAGLQARIKQGQALALKLSATPGMEQAATMVNQQVNDLQKDVDRLEERSTEVPRAVAKEEALQPLKIAQQQAGAQVQLEAKMNEPIGTENAIEDGLDPPRPDGRMFPKGHGCWTGQERESSTSLENLRRRMKDLAGS